jgi:hypothetical protein
MTKSFSILYLLVLASCTSLIPYPLPVFFKNTCGYSVQVTTPYYTNYADFYAQKVIVEPNNNAPVFYVIINDISNVVDALDAQRAAVPEDYSLEISANENTIRLDAALFKKELEQAQYTKKNCGFFSGKCDHEWTIDNPALCPASKPDKQPASSDAGQ